MHGTLPARVLVVTASDSRFMPFLRGMLASIAPCLAQPAVSLACFDIGLTSDDRRSLQSIGATLAVPQAHLGVDPAAHGPALRSFLARPFLPEYFPGHDVYVWIDSDVWLQDRTVFADYVAGARHEGMAITHEREASYRFQPWLLGWTTKHFLLGYGIGNTAWLLSRPHLNAGFFAIHADAPHWRAWAAHYEAAIRRTGRLVPHDQFALNQALHGPGRQGSLGLCVLEPRCNWICDRGVPMWNEEAGQFCEPRPPFRPIGAMHLAGPAKRTSYRIRRSGGGHFTTCLLHGASPLLPALSPL
jgi:hypothetical protein